MTIPYLAVAKGRDEDKTLMEMVRQQGVTMDVPSPDFHRPDFFREVSLAGN